MNDRKVQLFEIVGTLFIIFLGAAIHFTFALSGNNPVVGAFSAVNESVWEHLKLPFWPSIFWLLIVLYPMRKMVGNFFSAKAIGLVLMVAIIPVVFYTYTAFMEEIFLVDISTFFIAVIVGQLVSIKLYKQTQSSKIIEGAAIAVIIFLTAIFVVFTFSPPYLPIFMDSNTGQYGIP